MKIYTYVLGISILLVLGCSSKSDTADALVKHVSASEFKDQIEIVDGQLIDIRTPAEFNSGHIEGAAMIDFYHSGFNEKIAKLDRNKPIFIYCRSGNRTSKSVSLLRQMGFVEIVNLRQGIIDWQRNGFVLTRS